MMTTKKNIIHNNVSDRVVYESKGEQARIVSSCWYPSEKQAVNARNALMRIPKGVYCQSFGENRPVKKKILGGWVCSNPIKDDRF